MSVVAASDFLAADYDDAAVGLVVRHAAVELAVARLPPQRLSPPVLAELLAAAEQPGPEPEPGPELELLTETVHGNEQLGTYRSHRPVSRLTFKQLLLTSQPRKE